VGKAILAFLPEERAADVIRRIRFERFTNRTIATPEALRVEMEKTHRRGYAVDDEELEEGLRCIAVPLLDAQRLPVAAVSISGPSFRVTAQKLPSIANQLLQCVRGISMDMGYTSSGRGSRAAWSARGIFAAEGSQRRTPG
jgi:DNA-binding IclR family transcriptional regulator